MTVTLQNLSWGGSDWKFGILQSPPSSVEYLVVGGGASAGAHYGGGGGAGGVLSSSLAVGGGTTYIVTVGAGGAAVGGTSSAGIQGSNSNLGITGSVTTITALGGGGGANRGSAPSTVGGSGGGGGGGGGGPSNGTPPQGSAGGAGYDSQSSSTGGGGGGFTSVGGAGAAANPAGYGGTGLATEILGNITSTSSITITSGAGRNFTVPAGLPAFTGGGTGIGEAVKIINPSSNSIMFASVNSYSNTTLAVTILSGVTATGTYADWVIQRTFAGGGSGGSQNGAFNTGGTAGNGTDGIGFGAGIGRAGAGIANTGAGGTGNGDNSTAGPGGSGIVVLRHPSSSLTASTTGSPNVITYGGYTIYKFWQSGTLTFPASSNTFTV